MLRHDVFASDHGVNSGIVIYPASSLLWCWEFSLIYPTTTSDDCDSFNVVVDGDTLVLGSGERVRPIGVNTPKKETVSLLELMVSSFAQTDALAKLLIEKGFVTEQEFLQKVSEERSTYQKMFNPTAH